MGPRPDLFADGNETLRSAMQMQKAKPAGIAQAQRSIRKQLALRPGDMESQGTVPGLSGATSNDRI